MSNKKLFIIESPGKQKKIQSFLGKDFLIIATCGHIMDLHPKKISVDVKKDFTPTYVESSDKKDVIKKIKKEASKAEIVYIATDLDREGALIAKGIASILPKNIFYKRVRYNSITKKDVLDGIENAGKIDTELVESAECRRILDRLVGWKCSFPTKQATGGISAGRVQSAALRILAEREKEIQSFIPQEYWPIEVELEKKNGERVIAHIRKPPFSEISNETIANEICDILKKEKWIVSKYDTKEKSTKAYPPFTTSTLYQSASSILGWGNKKTAQVAQKLYENSFCLMENEFITLSNGSIVPIQEAYKYIGENVKSFGNKINDLRVQDTKIIDFQKLKYKGKIYDIRTYDGQEISITSDHKLLTYHNKEFIWKTAAELKQNDIAICAKKIKCKREKREIDIIDFILLLPRNIIEKILVQFNVKNRNYVLQILEEKKSEIKTSTYYKYKRNLKIPLVWCIKKYDEKTIKFLKKNIQHYQWQQGHSKKEKIDAKKFCYFLGLCLGDGHICSGKSCITFPTCITTNDKWGKICKGIKFEQKTNIDKKTTGFSGKILHELCSFFGGATGKKGDKIYIHPFISSLPEEYIYNFIAGLFDSDGCIKKIKYNNKGHRYKINISYATISQKMLKQMGVLLRTIGISNSMHRRKNDCKNGNIKIWEGSVYHFLSIMKNFLIIKKDYVEYLLSLIDNKKVVFTGKSRNSNFPIMDIIEGERKNKKITKQKLSQYIFGNNSGYWAYTRVNLDHNRTSWPNKENVLKMNDFLQSQLIMDIIEGDEYFTPIRDINIREYNGFVYDISTATENFIANSFYSHNCTYIRSDSTYIVPEFISFIRDKANVKYGQNYVSSHINIFSNKKTAQEAHEAIRVTDVETEHVETGDPQKLYTIIWKRTIACQMENLLQKMSNAEFTCNQYIFGASGSKVFFYGFRKCWDYGNLGDNELPEFEIGEELKCISVKTEQKFTVPPSHYTESSLTKELEKRGIGRPSTFAAIPETLLKREYIKKEKNTLYATEMGIRVSDFLVESDFCFVNLEFTAQLEDKLDGIAQGQTNKLCVLTEFWERLKEDLDRAKNIKSEKSKTEYKCPKCDGYLELKHSRYGPFYSCENRTNKDIKCDYKCKMGKNGEPVEQEEKKVEESEFKCSNCGDLLIKRTSKKGWVYLSCRNWNKNKSCEGFFDRETGEKITFKEKKKWKKKKKK